MVIKGANHTQNQARKVKNEFRAFCPSPIKPQLPHFMVTTEFFVAVMGSASAAGSTEPPPTALPQDLQNLAPSLRCAPQLVQCIYLNEAIEPHGAGM